MSPAFTVVAAAAAVVYVGGRVNAAAVACQETGVAAKRGTTAGDALLVGIAVFVAFAAIVEFGGEVGAAIAAVDQPRGTATYPFIADSVGGALFVAAAAMVGVRGEVDALAVAESLGGVALGGRSAGVVCGTGIIVDGVAAGVIAGIAAVFGAGGLVIGATRSNHQRKADQYGE